MNDSVINNLLEMEGRFLSVMFVVFVGFVVCGLAWLGLCAFGGRAIDVVFRVVCNVIYTIHARLWCGGMYPRRVVVSNGPAIIGTPGPMQVNIVDMRGPANERLQVITRGRDAPEWADVEASATHLESIIMCAELHALRRDASWETVDITALVYHLPRHHMITPIDICALVFGTRIANSCDDCRVEILMMDRSVTFCSADIVTSDIQCDSDE